MIFKCYPGAPTFEYYSTVFSVIEREICGAWNFSYMKDYGWLGWEHHKFFWEVCGSILNDQNLHTELSNFSGYLY